MLVLATDSFKVTELEKRIITFSKRLKVSSAELIRISDKDLWDIKSENDIVSLAYAENEDKLTSVSELSYRGVRHFWQ